MEKEIRMNGEATAGRDQPHSTVLLPQCINTGDGRRAGKPNPEVSRPGLEAGKARLTT